MKKLFLIFILFFVLITFYSCTNNSGNIVLPIEENEEQFIDDSKEEINDKKTEETEDSKNEKTDDGKWSPVIPL